MGNETKPESIFELIEDLETRHRLLKAVVIVCMILAPIGLAADVYSFVVLTHQKGGLLDQQIIFIAFIFFALVSVLLFSADRYNKLRRWDRSLKQLELLEDTIYREVLQPKTI